MNLFSAKNGQYLQDSTARVPRKTLVFPVPLISWLLRGKSIVSEKIIKNIYCKVARSRLSWLVAHFMKGNFDSNVL